MRSLRGCSQHHTRWQHDLSLNYSSFSSERSSRNISMLLTAFGYAALFDEKAANPGIYIAIPA